MNLANKLTFFRVVLIPAFLLVLYFNKPWSDVVATIIFAVACLTDFFDGYVARKYGMITDFGKILDPVADKVLVAATMIALVEMGRLAGWIAIVILARDFAVGALRDVSLHKGIIIPAGIWGKIKTTSQMLALGMIVYNGTLMYINWKFLGMILIYVAVALSIYSAYIYFKDYMKLNKIDTFDM